MVSSGGSLSIRRASVDRCSADARSGRHRKERAVAPRPAAPRSAPSSSLDRQLDEIVVERARDQRLEPAAHEQVGLEPLAAGLDGEPHRMLGAGRDDVVDVGAEDEALRRGRCPCTSISTARNGASATSTSTFSAGVTR